MAQETKAIEIAPGTILAGRRQFIKRVFVDSPNDVIDIQMPGQVLRCGEDYDFSILPYAQVVERNGALTRAALLGAEVRDERGLDRAMFALREKHGASPIEGFAIRVASHRSLGAALDAGESGGCGCGGGAARAGSLPATLAVGIRHNGDFIWTHPVAAHLIVFASLYSGEGSFVFDCHSVWFGWTDRSTACEGPCPAKLDCRCDNAGEPRVRFNCFGEWRICICK